MSRQQLIMINSETGEAIEPMHRSEAEQITERIGDHLGDIANRYEQVMPLIREAMTRHAWAALDYRSAGEYIAEEFGGALERLGAEARRGVVRELSAAGMSTRAIAPVIGKDQKTVRNDLRSGEDFSSPDHGGWASPSELLNGPPEVEAKVIGIDGKAYRRPIPKPESMEDAEQRQIEQGRRDTCTRIAECVRFLDGGREYGHIFLRGSYPYEAEYLAPGMRLTAARVDSAIEFLQTVREEVTR